MRLSLRHMKLSPFFGAAAAALLLPAFAAAQNRPGVSTMLDEVPQVRDALKRAERSVERAGRALAAVLPVRDLTVDARARGLRVGLWRAAPTRRTTLALDTAYGLGEGPWARLLWSGAEGRRELEARTQEHLQSGRVEGRWRAGRLFWRAGATAEGIGTYGLGLALGAHQRLDFTVGTGPAAERRADWSLRLPI